MENLFIDLLKKSVEAHGHLCPGQVLGVRMGILGLALLGYPAPLDSRNIKKVVVYVEIDRCAADALMTTTGVKLGRRSLKFKDYGLMAATFINLPDGRAFRVSVREEVRDKASKMFPHIPDSHVREVEAYQVLPATDLFTVEEVRVDIPTEDIPGYHGHKARCDACGTTIRHRREIERDGRVLCINCAGAGYFNKLKDLNDIDRLDPVVGISEGSAPKEEENHV